MVSGAVERPPPGGGLLCSPVYAGGIPARGSSGLLPGLLPDQNSYAKRYIYDVLGCERSTVLVLIQLFNSLFFMQIAVQPLHGPSGVRRSLVGVAFRAQLGLTGALTFAENIFQGLLIALLRRVCDPNGKHDYQNPYRPR